MKNSPTADTQPELSPQEVPTARPPISSARDRLKNALGMNRSRQWVKLLGDMVRKWRLKEEGCKLIGCNDSSFEELIQGERPMTGIELNLLRPSIEIYQLLDLKFTPVEADKWMNRPESELDGETPSHLVLQEGGASKVATYLKALPDRNRDSSVDLKR